MEHCLWSIDEEVDLQRWDSLPKLTKVVRTVWIQSLDTETQALPLCQKASTVGQLVLDPSNLDKQLSHVPWLGSSLRSDCKPTFTLPIHN